MKKFPISGRSTCWWAQKVTATLVFLFLAFFSLRFVWLANLDTIAVGISVGDDLEFTPVTPGEGEGIPDPSFLTVPGINVHEGDRINVYFGVELRDGKRVP